MRVRDIKEIQSLDDDLHLFDETDWGFYDVLEEQNKNFEYFNDVPDNDFTVKKGIKASDLFAMSSLLAVIVLSLLLLFNSGIFNDSDFNEIKNLRGVQESVNMSYVEGTEVSSSDLVEISTLLNRYFSIVKSEYDYGGLNELCDSGSSSFASTYYTATGKVKILFDENDCYARTLRKFGSFCTVGKIKKVIERDGIYYCYVDFSFPSIPDIQEYINLYSFNMTKFFKTHEINEQNVVKFILDTAEANPMVCHTEEYCIKLRKRGDTFVLASDAFLTDLCTSAYSSAVSQCTTLLGNNTLIP